MSRSSNEGSWGRRKSLFALSTLTPMTNDADGSVSRLKKQSRHGRSGSQRVLTDVYRPDLSRDTNEPQSAPPSSESPRLPRPSLSMKGSMRRPPSVFGSLPSTMRGNSEEKSEEAVGEPLSSTSSTAPSVGYSDSGLESILPSKTVVLHGEVQTSAGMFRKKKEYLVLTETHILRYKSQGKAADTFKVIPHPIGRTPTIKHGSVPSAGSQNDLQALSESSGDKDGRVPLRQVVAVHRLDDGKPYFAIEVCYLDEESSQASNLTLQFGNPEERDVWLKNVHTTVRHPRLQRASGIATFNLENAARIVERENDYDPNNCSIYKVVQRQSASRTAGRSSSDDLAKVASTVGFLVIGVHKVHIIQLAKPIARTSSPSLALNNSQASYGILTLNALKVSGGDDTFELTFRQPLQRTRTLYLASTTSHEIAARLHGAENFLRPECGHRLFRFSAPAMVEDILPPAVTADEENACLDRTLTAYCVAYGVNPGNVRYTINDQCEDAPRFELLPPADVRRVDYGPIELLAITRALRYNESFGSITFAGICLDSLNGLHDNYGQEYVCSRTKKGTPIRLTADELGRSCLLVQEIRALAATSKKLRRMDFSGCVTSKPAATMDNPDDEGTIRKDIGCGVVEALFPLSKHQTTNVDWVCLNRIQLTETDLDYLVGAAVEKSCHLRAIEMNRCGLTDRSMGLILDALRAQDNTLEAIEIAGNNARLNPSVFDSQLAVFGFIRKLNLSYFSRTSGSEPVLQAETLLIWRLQELRLSGTTLNEASIDAIATYLAHPQSSSLHELYFDHAHLSGKDVATLLHSMSRNPFEARDLHLDISQSHITEDLLLVTQAISNGLAPSHLSMRAVEYREEASFRKMLNALTVNKTIRYLDLSHTALPGDASEETCRALERLLAENDTLLELDLSGEESRLAISRFGSGINHALGGLKHNKTMQCFRIERQKLGLQGASTLAEVLKENKTLRELHCDNNEIPLHGLTDLVNSLIENTTLVHLPSMADGRKMAFKSAEMTMKSMSDVDSQATPRSPQFSTPSASDGTSVMKRGFANVRRTARSASAYAPSFPALPSQNRSTSSSHAKPPSPYTTTSQPSTKTRQNSQSPMIAPVSFTTQDIQTTHRLLTEQWDRQCYRLAQYLDRNWCLLNGMPVQMQIEDEAYERPSSVGSIGKMLEAVKSDTTPRNEKALYFDSPQSVHPPADAFEEKAVAQLGGLSEEMRTKMSFKQFILESEPGTPDGDEVAAGLRQLRVATGRGGLEEPGTPTQAGFTG
ncbi:hypothetical protein LTR59_011521 [Friedmanniomyces endolithicus]|nr:hypothetical protein LTR59_011521 [Friedmanniomyces endolithicus]KAK0786443.1 hypothetical protein LTR75_013191 [Friedmanniomyces endolithicus]KAK0847128.1 hypothetical protein LTR03_006474 [Friedmanniomyces endolithicus]